MFDAKKIRHVKSRAHVDRFEDFADEILCLHECLDSSVTFKVCQVERLKLRDCRGSGLECDRSLAECPDENISFKGDRQETQE